MLLSIAIPFAMALTLPMASHVESAGRRLTADAAWALTCRLANIQPLQLGVDVAVKPSEGRGQGVFALRRIEPGTLIGRYEGRLLSDEQYNAVVRAGATSGDYAFTLG